jgi:hypothetical protein
MKLRLLHSVFCFYLASTAVTCAASYGIFKSEWNTYPVNKDVPVAIESPKVERSPISYTAPSGETIEDKLKRVRAEALPTTPAKYEQTTVYVRSLSIACVNSELQDDWKAALRGNKTYYCALRIDAYLAGNKVYRFKVVFYDSNGIQTGKLTFDTTHQNVAKTHPLEFSTHPSSGAPVSFQFECVDLQFGY